MSNSKENLIIWQKWHDPFGEKEDDIDDPVDNFFYEDEDNDQIEDEEVAAKPKRLTKQIKVIATPMGIIPMNENTSSGKIFNFWIGHTNFNITKGVCNIIESSEGVETLDIFTRYRFRISVGKVFTDSIVMKNIQESVYEHIENIK